jgi:HEPN domain-containing protein
MKLPQPMVEFPKLENKEKIIRYWIETSDEDFNTMQKLVASESYGWALFLGHISVEKMLKALYVKTHEKHAPYIHNLYRLAEISDLKITDEYADWLDKITSFNLHARYDDYKREFYTLCTPVFTKEWVEKITIIRSWIRKML